MRVSRPELVELLSAMVAIDSINPSLVQGAAGESELAAFVSGWAEGQGLETSRLEVTEGRPSVLVRAPGSGAGKTLLLCGHLDTVGHNGMTDPHLPRVEGDRLHGRGAYDMKAGLAAALLACRDAAALGLAGDVVVAAVADEEYESVGVQEVLATVSADAAVVTEPTQMEVAIAHRGFVWLEIEVSGRAAHGSRPDLGVDAIVRAGPLLSALGVLDEELGDSRHPLVGRGSVHASVISGGDDLATYPASCTVGLERRTLPGEGGDEVRREIEALVGRCAERDSSLEAEVRTLLVRDAFELDEDAPLVGAVRRACEDVLGVRPPITGAPFWTDAAFIAAAGVPTLLLGPGGEGAHAAEEFVSISDSVACSQILRETARELCA